MIPEELYDEEDRAILADCTLCPRECGVDRFSGGAGYCGVDAGLNIASICIHRGEEPVISGINGICNIFFTGCNLHCSFCQNHEISHPGFSLHRSENDIESVLSQIEAILSQGITSVGFVSPSHMVPQVKAIIKGLKKRGVNPITVYNTNGYDKKDTIDSLSELIDVYLPDYKYVNPQLSNELSDASDYPAVALKSN